MSHKEAEPPLGYEEMKHASFSLFSFLAIFPDLIHVALAAFKGGQDYAVEQQANSQPEGADGGHGGH